MPSVSSIVREIVNGNKLLSEGMRQGIVNYAAVAEKISKQVEDASGSKVSDPAIIMALRRYSEVAILKEKKDALEFNSEIIMKTALAYISFPKFTGALEKLQKFQSKINPGRDTFNVIEGNYEIAIITNQKYSEQIKQLMGSGHIIIEEKNLVSLTITLGQDFAYTPGMMFEISRKLYWDDVNMFEIITTATELTLLFLQKDAMKAYNSINRLMMKK